MLAIQPTHSNRSLSSANPARVMLIDDSAVARSIFERILLQSHQIEIVCQAENPEIALLLLARHSVDIILLDIEMPGRSGLDALPDLLEQSNGARVLVVSSFAEENGPAAIHALSLGACDTLGKPARCGFSGHFSQILLDKVIHLGQRDRRNAVLGCGAIDAPITPVLASFELSSRPSCLAIGASTGGIPAIYDLIGNLDATIDCPIFITQHLPSVFMAFFAKQLGSKTNRRVLLAERGMIVQNNQVYLAPGGAHLVCHRDGSNVVLDHSETYETTRYCPSVDVMFHSIADVYGRDAVAIVLSGMGTDGTQGVRSLNAIGATIIVQDAATSVVWGMPGNVARSNLADVTLPPHEIGKLISRAAGGRQ